MSRYIRCSNFDIDFPKILLNALAPLRFRILSIVFVIVNIGGTYLSHRYYRYLGWFLFRTDCEISIGANFGKFTTAKFILFT